MKEEKIFNSMGFAGNLGKLGTVIANLKDGLDDVTELVGKLKALVRVTVTFDSDGGNPVASQSIPFGSYASPPLAPGKVGFTFEGWFDGDVEFDFNETALEADITLLAHWAVDES